MESDFGWERDYGNEEECEYYEGKCDDDDYEENGTDEMLERTFKGGDGKDVNDDGDDDSNGLKSAKSGKRSRESPNEIEKEYIALDDDDDEDDMEYYRQKLKNKEKSRRSKQRKRYAAQQVRKPSNRTFASGNEYFVQSLLRWEAKTLKHGENGGRISGIVRNTASNNEHALPLEEAPMRYASMDEFFHAQIEVAFAEAKAIIAQGLKKDSTKKETCNVKAREKSGDNKSACLKLEVLVTGRRHNGSYANSSNKEDDWKKSGSVVLIQPKKKGGSSENEGTLGIVVDVSNTKDEYGATFRNKYVHVQTSIKTENVDDQLIVTPLGNVLTQKRIVAVAVSRPKISFEAQVLGTKNATYTRFSDSEDDSDGERNIKMSTADNQRKSAVAEEEVNDELNESQRFALERFMNDRSPGYRLKMVQGPPGTGKTHFCAKLLQELTNPMRNEQQRLLVCAPSNKAVIVCLETFLRNIPKAEDRDKIGRSIALYGVEDALESAAKDVNIINEFYVHRRLDSLCAKLKKLSSDGTNRKNGGRRSKADVMAGLKNVREEMKRIATFLIELGVHVSELLLNPCDRKNVSQNMEIESTVQDFIERIEGKTRADNLRNRDVLAKAVLSSARLCFCTLGSCGGLYHSGAADYDVLIVDEAANCLEGEILLAFARNPKRCLLIGDPQQLPAMCFSQDVQRLGYNKSLMERLFSCYSGDQNEVVCTMLKTQYRMHPEICAWPSERFYGGKLQNADCVKNPNNALPYSIVNVHSGKHRVSSNSSMSNAREAEIAVELVQKLCRKSLKIGIITFYTAQVKLITNLMRAKNIPTNDDVFASTVDSFQGSEADVIILSCVRTSKTSAGFLSDSRRLNVSLTRAKKKLIVLCNADALSGGGETLEMLDLKSLIENAKSRNVLFSESVSNILDTVAAF
jgi:superfamily I DNA and/or RNA helicase